MTQSFSEAVLSTVHDYQDGIRKRTEMYGTPAEVEAMWWTLLSFEALSLTPMPDSDSIEDAKRTSHERVAQTHGWPPVHSLHANVSWRPGLVAVLDEWRTEFFRVLNERR